MARKVSQATDHLDSVRKRERKISTVSISGLDSITNPAFVETSYKDTLLSWFMSKTTLVQCFAW